MRNLRLSFVEYSESGAIRNGWIQEVSGDWTADSDKGVNRANEMVAHIKLTDDLPIFRRVVGDAIKIDGATSGLVTGFLFRIAELMKDVQTI